jgi:hypothetical protein
MRAFAQATSRRSGSAGESLSRERGCSTWSEQPLKARTRLLAGHRVRAVTIVTSVARSRDAVQLGSRALAELRHLEDALDDLADVEPRGSVLASVMWLVRERIERHHLRPHAPIVDEWLEKAA